MNYKLVVFNLHNIHSLCFISCRFDFSRYIFYATYIDISIYLNVSKKIYLEKSKRYVIQNRGSELNTERPIHFRKQTNFNFLACDRSRHRHGRARSQTAGG
jgi:hypothetical protein